VKTDLWDGMATDAREAMFRRAEQNLLVGRAGEAEDLAEAYVYLMKNGFSTGQIVVADGGVSVG
jgi:NAD(P)-dependent dehydrogenase (short-subunit alcohol dehydrogenase family)